MSQEKQQNDYWINMIVEDLSDNISMTSKKELEEWLIMSDSNQKLYTDLKEIWLTLDIVDQSNKHDDKIAFLQFREKIRSKVIEKTPRKLFIPTFLKYTAVIVPFLFMSYFTFSYFTEDSDSSLASISVPDGSTSKVEFKDGSKVWLNSGSEIKVANNFGKKERRIELEGEAYLEVAHNTSLPFVVQTEMVDVKVLGTTFSVNASNQGEEVKVTLESGSVQLLFNEGETVLLKPREQAIYNTKTKSIRVENADMNKVLAWKNNYLIFTGETFENITISLERRFNVRIEIKNNAIRKQSFFGDFVNDESIEQILNVMSSKGRFSYKRQGNIIEIY